MNEEKRLKKVLKSGDIDLIHEYFDELYNKYKGLVCFIISKYINNKEDVYDVAQEVFLSFFNNADTVSSSIKYYLVTTSKNKSINFLRKKNKINYVDDYDFDVLYETENNNDMFIDLINLLKSNLSQIEYEIVILHLINNSTFFEISNKYKTKESTVKSIYYRSIKKVRKIIERSNENE